MSSKPEKAKRTRASLPKVRQDVLPANTGRTCDGYPNNKYLEPSVDIASIVSKHRSTLSIALSNSLPGTSTERRSFDYFRFHTGYELARAIGLLSWHRLILQASHSDPVVRHAAIAVGCIGERLRIHNVLTLQNQDANSCHVYARLQYQKALELLRQHLSIRTEKSVLVVLVSCFLFMCFEFLQGNDAGVCLHLDSGVKIVRSIQEGTTCLEAHDASATSGSLKDDILQIFAIMDMCATIWLGRKGSCLPEIPIVPLIDDRYLGPTPAKDFTTLEDAAISIIGQVNQIFYLQRSFPAADKWDRTDKAVLDAFTEWKRLETQLEKWPDAVELLLVRRREDLSPDYLHLVGVMSTNCKLASIMLKMILETDEQAIYAALEPEFVQIVALATSLLRPDGGLDQGKPCSLPRDFPQYDPGSTGMFSFVVGLIAPLFYTAIKCRNRALVQDATTLLSSRPWREGAWDSAAMARIAQRKIRDLERQGWYTDEAEPVRLPAPAISISASDRGSVPAGSSYVYTKLKPVLET